MFLVKYFIDSFQFKTLLKNEEKSMFKLIIFFILMVLIATFPLTYEAVKNDGSRLNFIIEDFKKAPTNWEFPNNFEIRAGKLVTYGDEAEYFYTHEDKNYYLNIQGDIVYKDYLNSIIFFEDKIVYIDSKGNYMEGHNYIGFSDVFQFDKFRTATSEERVEYFQQLASGIEKSFASYTILNTIIRNISTQLFINVIYVLILSLLVQLYKFGYEKFMSFKEGIKFVILSLGPASIFAFIVGIFSSPFAPLAFQVITGLIVMVVPLLFGKKLYS